MIITIAQPQLAVSISAPNLLSVSIAPVVVPVLSVTVNPVVLQIAGGGGSIRVIGEVPTGAINGSNATYQSAFDFVPESVEVFAGGHRLTLLQDYNTAGTRTITLYTSPLTGENLRVNYQKQL